MSRRLPRLTPDELDADQRALYAQLTAGPRAGTTPMADADGRLLGPFDAMLRNPAVGHPLQALGARLRYGGRLPARTRELVVLTVAAHWGSAFETAAHERAGAAAGLSTAEMRALRPAAGAPPVDAGPPSTDAGEAADPGEAAAVSVARALLTRGDVSDPEYAELSGALPAPLMFEVVCLVGYYTTLAWTMRTFRSDHPLPS